ncbi:hypothetical protein N0V84_005317 [Fusarium piperis]|uniref:Uncharacterized protein n=1 Tax=Fusarium piperis TaxID=1435070 RepID=A0A9W8WDZ9_9HYPO|nr:hypothetical protein N0V84_005317 [Fusarium piperis]
MENTLRRRDGRVWSDSNRLQLLAYLNWCVTYRDNLLQTGQDHLKRVTGNDFTETQIRRKLLHEWDKRGLCANFDDVFSQGTPSLNLSEEEQNEIQSIFTGLCHNLQESRNDTRATRLRSRAAPKTVKTPTNKRQAIRLALTIKNSPIRSEESPPLLGYSANDDGDEGNAVNLIPVSDTESKVIEPSTTCLRIRSIDLQSAPQGPSPLPSPGPTGPPSDCIASLQAELLKLKGHNFALQNRVSELEMDHTEIRRFRESADGDIEYCTRTVHYLEKQLETMSAHLHNVADSETGRLGLPTSTIAQEYKVLYLDVLDASQTFCEDHSSPRISTNAETAHPVRVWARKASGRDFDPLLCHYNIQTVPNSRLVVALIGAGLFDLVFERAFPEILSAESPLTNGYRRHILTKDGSDALRLADLAALESLTQGDRASKDRLKERMIDEKAKHLSEFMLQSLSFCMAENHQPATSDDDSDTKEVPPDLDILLRQALKLKLALTTSMTRLKFYFFWPGADFDETSMEKDYMSGDGGVVKLCLFPALFSVPRETLGTRLEESRWAVDSHHDRYLTNATEEEVASLPLVARAVVLT